MAPHVRQNHTSPRFFSTWNQVSSFFSRWYARVRNPRAKDAATGTVGCVNSGFPVNHVYHISSETRPPVVKWMNFLDMYLFVFWATILDIQNTTSSTQSARPAPISISEVVGGYK